MNNQEKLAQITQLTKKLKLTKLEQKRLCKDLEAVQKRLETREYRLGGFNMNVFDVPDRTREFYIYLKFYCDIGLSWKHIFSGLKVNRYKEIIDLCPGYTPKIELGLFYSNYKGTLFVIDKDKNAIKELNDLLALFQPAFQIKPIIIDLFQKTPKKGLFVTGNHFIDDFALSYFAQKWKIKISDIYEKEGMAVSTWNKIIAKKEHLKEVVEKTAKVIAKCVEKQGYICLTQYESYMERLLGLKKVTKFNELALKEIKKILIEKHGFQDEHHIVNKALKNKRTYLKSNHFILLKNVSN